MPRKRGPTKVRFSSHQRNQIPPSTLELMKEMGIEIKTKDRETAEWNEDNKRRKRPVPTADFTSCCSCPDCGSLFFAGGKDLQEALSSSRGEATAHLVLEHDYSPEKVNEWNQWLLGGTKSQDGAKEELGGDNATDIEW
jgi:hypothetical protein